jgi:hypothetical protein
LKRVLSFRRRLTSLIKLVIACVIPVAFLSGCGLHFNNALLQTGVFECQPGDTSHGIVMRQMAVSHPVAWRPDEQVVVPAISARDDFAAAMSSCSLALQRPFTVFAADASWTDEDMTVDALLPTASDALMLGVRANPNGCSCGRVITGEDMMPGAWLIINSTGSWKLYNAVSNVSTSTGLLASGTSALAPSPGSWHSYNFAVSAGHLSASLDNEALFEGIFVQGAVPDSGFVGFGTGSWGQYVEFDNFSVLGNASTGRQFAVIPKLNLGSR